MEEEANLVSNATSTHAKRRSKVSYFYQQEVGVSLICEFLLLLGFSVRGLKVLRALLRNEVGKDMINL